MPKRYASIDIGTNTLRLLIAKYATSSHGMKPLGYKRSRLVLNIYYKLG